MSRPDWLLPPVDQLTEFPAQAIARQLGGLRRYAGATLDHYSVARHSLLVMELMSTGEDDLRLLALVHDAHECWTGDVLRPASVRFKLPLEELQHEHDAKLWSLLGLDPDPVSLTIVKRADDTACKLEMQLLGKPQEAITDAMPGLSAAAWHLCFHSNAQVDAMHWRTAFEDLRKVMR